MPRTRPELLELRSNTARALGARIAEARIRRGLAQADAALYLGVPQSAIAKLERGQRLVSFLEALDLAALYGVSPSDFDPRSGETNPDRPSRAAGRPPRKSGPRGGA